MSQYGMFARHTTSGVLFTAFLVWLTAAADAQQVSDAPSVVVAEVERRDVTPSHTHVGRVEAIETVELIARVEGFLQERNFREGSEVRKGDVLFVIEQAPYQIAVEQRKAELAGARATLENAEIDFARKEVLVKRKTIAQASLDEARAVLGTARAAVQQAKATLRRAELDLAYTSVISPIDGMISRATYSVGSLVGPTNGTLATVTSIDPIYVTIAVTEKDLIVPVWVLNLRLSDGSL